VLNHRLLDQLDSSICDLVPGESVEFGGEWTTSSRQAYKSEAQIGTGSGPFVEVVDFRWRGALTAAGPFSGIAFLLTADNLYWAKAPEVSLTLPVHVSLHAYAGYTAEGATFTASLAGAFLPGAPVACRRSRNRYFVAVWSRWRREVALEAGVELPHEDVRDPSLDLGLQLDGLERLDLSRGLHRVHDGVADGDRHLDRHGRHAARATGRRRFRLVAGGEQYDQHNC